MSKQRYTFQIDVEGKVYDLTREETLAYEVDAEFGRYWDAQQDLQVVIAERLGFDEDVDNLWDWITEDA